MQFREPKTGIDLNNASIEEVLGIVSLKIKSRTKHSPNLT